MGMAPTQTTVSDALTLQVPRFQQNASVSIVKFDVLNADDVILCSPFFDPRAHVSS